MLEHTASVKVCCNRCQAATSQQQSSSGTAEEVRTSRELARLQDKGSQEDHCRCCCQKCGCWSATSGRQAKGSREAGISCCSQAEEQPKICKVKEMHRCLILPESAVYFCIFIHGSKHTDRQEDVVCIQPHCTSMPKHQTLIE